MEYTESKDLQTHTMNEGKMVTENQKFWWMIQIHGPNTKVILLEH